MIRKEDGEYLAECNGCGSELAGGTEDNFAAFVAYLKDEGWRITKDDEDGTWQHWCPDCQ